MLLQQIVELLDAELDRMVHLRALVASLNTASGGDFAIDAVELAAAADTLPPSELEIQVVKLPPSRRGQKRSRNLTRKAEPTEVAAVASRIPAGPVVITADALAREKSRRLERSTVEQKTVPQAGSLGAMIKALELRTAV